MGLFQHSVLRKYIADTDTKALDTAWQKYKKNFHDIQKQENIRNAKEEQYQEGFLRELFVDVLGYTLNPDPNYNLTTEYKNEKDSKKADGAILKDGNVIAVIELKGTDTTDLNKVESQAFNYKNNQKGCTYVITSNFEKLRLYINDATEFEEFNLFTLTEQQFSFLYLCLQANTLLNHLPLQMKQQSVAEEENITRKLYADYAAFKRKLYNNIVLLNPQHDKLLLFKKTQKLLDRFLFIFFAEDRLLLPPNSVREILQQWQQLKELDNYVPLYERFKKYFGYLNLGYKGKLYEIFAYNGGLFAEDEVLETIAIDDEMLYQSCITLSNYNFDTEVDVNILGHIFEHSLNEIEELQAQAEGKALDKTKTKRKKDGVFYTPRYITKYIVENTVGSLCEQKKQELKIDEDNFTANKRKDNKRKLLEQLEAYRQWLLQLTICDPACGSGAFLNQALDFLLAEHRYVDELKAKLFGDSIVYSDVEKEILEHNLFGVDINEEAVEIARLSLWLRTAHKGRKLNNLSNNIKCGNSLIDDATVAGEKAFNWQNEFPQVFAKGGFDVVIGNPPWGAKLNELSTKFLVNNYALVPTKLKDTYMYFMLASMKLLKLKGYLGFIVPNTWLLINNTSEFRKHFLEHNVLQIIDYGDSIFEDAIVESATIILTNESTLTGNVIAAKYRDGNTIANHIINKQIWLEDELHRIVLELKLDSYAIIKKLEIISEPFDKKCDIIFGIKPYQVGHGIPPQTQEMVDKRIYHSNQKHNNEWYPLVTGTDVSRYNLEFNGNEYIKYGKWLMYSSNEDKINNEKILLRRTSHDLKAVYDNQAYYPQNSLFIITSSHNLKYILCLLNSRLFDFIYKAKCPQVGKIFAEVKPSIIKSLPIVSLTAIKQQPFIEQADIMLIKNKELQQVQNNFIQLLQSKFATAQINKKLTDWYNLNFGAFIKELEKQKIKLSLNEQSEWMPFFEAEKSKALAIQQTITQTDKEIDNMVYALYGLTEEEIKIVESA